MNTVAITLANEMLRISNYVDLVTSVFDLARIPLTPLRARQTLAAAVADTHTKARAVTLGDSLAFEGVYLSACAMFEEAVRDMIEVCADQMAAKKTTYTDLPEKMRKAHLDGCGTILGSLREDRFSHLNETMVVSSLASCYCPPPSPAPAYVLTTEALSAHRNNFRPEILRETVGRLGIDNLWGRMGQEATLQALFPGASADDTKRFAEARLTSIMLKRNGIIHRGTAFVPPTATEVKEAADFFAALMQSLANVLVSYLASL